MMYKYLRILMNATDAVGDVDEVLLGKKTQYVDDRIEISGTTDDGKMFALEFRVKEVNQDA